MSTFNMFMITQGKLVIRSRKTQEILWAGRPYEIDVKKVLPIPNSVDFVVLLDWRKASMQNKKNLVRLDPHGNIIWEVESALQKNLFGPNRDDSGLEVYTSVNISGDSLTAYAYSGYSDSINVQTGEIMNSTFVK